MIDYSNVTFVTTVCNRCKTNLAEIFQESGEYCLLCWQEKTYPNL
jgi:anaerobic ribonucleoside-triphosphate reductase